MRKLTDTDFRRIRDAIALAVDEHHLPGLAVGVVQSDDLVFSEGAGYADIESASPMDPARQHRIASVTKTMVALTVMALVDEGRLRLDDRVVDHLSDVVFEGPGEQITISHLLTHTSGIGEAATDAQLAAAVNPAGREEAGDFGTLFPTGIVVEVAPGTKWAYCNIGFGLLGEIIVRSERASLPDVLARRIFGPLGMHDTNMLGLPDKRLSTGYHRPPNADTRELFERAGMAVPDETPVDGYNIRGRFRGVFGKGMLAAGAVHSTVPDMARYASALLRRGAGIVRPETFDIMIAPQYGPDPRLTSWGLGFSRVPRFGRTFIGHGGAYFGGWNTNFSILPDEQLSIIIFQNIMLDSPRPAFDSIKRAVLDAPASTMPPARTDANVLATAPGVYECAPGRLTNFRISSRVGRVQITRDGDELVMYARRGDWKRGVRLVPADPSDPGFFAAGDAADDLSFVSLALDRDGSVDGLRFDDLAHLVRNDAIEPWAP